MTVRRLVNNDYSFGHGKADLITGLDACLQKCQTQLMQLQGEWFIDRRDGVPWGEVLGQKTNLPALSDIIKKTLLDVAGVTAVAMASVERHERSMLVIAKLTTIYGEVDFVKSLNVLETLGASI